MWGHKLNLNFEELSEQGCIAKSGKMAGEGPCLRPEEF